MSLNLDAAQQPHPVVIGVAECHGVPPVIGIRVPPFFDRRPALNVVPVSIDLPRSDQQADTSSDPFEPIHSFTVMSR